MHNIIMKNYLKNLSLTSLKRQVANAAHKYCEIGSLIWKRSNLSVGKRANLHANAHFRCCYDQLMLQFIAHLQLKIEMIVT